ncbi:rod shape-determining protein MreC [Scopulibacillus darangshiensis]|uniref:Cell shape-determining protein MreC n=1 Tax=Scopulibacillus darangshiensis TaxID=442528 RepID=A0A4R2PCS2_9BACL|nr:rod shape-determining protein MreC [Scopulibacillus darangshiensis]TCP32238.1 rod shape-determining protein MreC [Scopulibacillus darangshiensis]
MPPFFSNKKLIILLASLIVLVALVGFSIKERKQMTWPEQFVHDTVGWFQVIFNRPAQYVAGFFETIDDIENAYKENKALKADLEDYAKVKQENKEIKHDNQELKKELDLLNDPDLSAYKKHPALVIGRSYDKWNQLVTVNKGEQDGIKPDMAVITPDGFIGKVRKAGQFSSEVILMTDTRNANQIAAMVQGSRIYGMIEGYDPEKNVLLFKKIPVKAKIKKGQMVVTSGLGQIFPRGLPIGKVKKVTTDQYGLTKIAEVEPAANLNDLTHVVIVEREAGTPAANNLDKKGDKS